MFHIAGTTEYLPLPESSQLSEIGTDFIKQCLTFDPIRRPSAVELLDHSWITEFRAKIINGKDEDRKEEVANDFIAC